MQSNRNSKILSARSGQIFTRNLARSVGPVRVIGLHTLAKFVFHFFFVEGMTRTKEVIFASWSIETSSLEYIVEHGMMYVLFNL